MSSPPRHQAVLFDYGGVLTGPVGVSIDAWLRADGIDPASFTKVLRTWMSRSAPEGTPVHRLETGELPPEEFEQLLAAELKTHHGTPVEPTGLLGRLFAGMRAAPEMFELVEQLKAGGVRVGLLSNSWGNTYPRQRINDLFDPVVISGEIGLRKPHAPIFEHALARWGLTAGEVVFIDDAGPNIEGARSLGLTAVHHTSAEATHAALTHYFPHVLGHASAATTTNSQQGDTA